MLRSTPVNGSDLPFGKSSSRPAVPALAQEPGDRFQTLARQLHVQFGRAALVGVAGQRDRVQVRQAEVFNEQLGGPPPFFGERRFAEAEEDRNRFSDTRSGFGRGRVGTVHGSRSRRLGGLARRGNKLFKSLYDLLANGCDLALIGVGPVRQLAAWQCGHRLFSGRRQRV